MILDNGILSIVHGFFEIATVRFHDEISTIFRDFASEFEFGQAFLLAITRHSLAHSAIATITSQTSQHVLKQMRKAIRASHKSVSLDSFFVDVFEQKVHAGLDFAIAPCHECPSSRGPHFA